MKKCHLRHPQNCRYFIIYENCKFENICKLNHEAIETMKESKQMDELRNRIIERKK